MMAGFGSGMVCPERLDLIVLKVRAVSVQSSPVDCVMRAQYWRVTVVEGWPFSVVA